MGTRGDWSYVGIDESNNGQSPQIFVSVFSNYPGDVARSKRPTMPKKRSRTHPKLHPLLAERAYSFVLVTRQDIDRLKTEGSYNMLHGLVVASLLQKSQASEDPTLYFDGQFSDERRGYVERALKLVPGIDEGRVKIHTGKDLDRRVRLVNIADQAAHWLYRRPLEKVAGNTHQRTLRMDLLEKIAA